MRIGRAALLTVLVTTAVPGVALGRSVPVPAVRGSVFAAYHRLHRAGLRVALAQGQTFTNRTVPQVIGSCPAAGRPVPTGSVVTLSLRVPPAAPAPLWTGRSRRLRLPTLVGTRASTIPPMPGVDLRLHLTRLDLGTGPGLLFNYVIVREQPAGGSTIAIRPGYVLPRVEFWARQIPRPAGQLSRPTLRLG